MEHISSVSRSGGLQKDGDTLKDFKTQEEYRKFIQKTLDGFWAKYPSASESEKDAQKRVDAQQNILIQFRKLREGLIASKRRDQFAFEVYETSLYLAVIFSATRHIPFIISHFAPSSDRAESVSPALHSLPSTIISCLYNLLAMYPSQAVFHERLRFLPSSHLPKDSTARAWLLSIARALREVNYTQFELISQARSYATFIHPPADHVKPHLSTRALETLIAALRAKARERTWAVMRSAYRELWCHEGSETTAWLGRCLCLEEGDGRMPVDRWLEVKEKEGQVKKKEGLEGRWTVCRVK